MACLTDERVLLLQRFSGTEVQELASEVLRLRGLLREVIAQGAPETGEFEGYCSMYRCCYGNASYPHQIGCWWIKIRDNIAPEKTN